MKAWSFDLWKRKEQWIQVGILDITLLVLSVVFLLGMLLFFGPCDLAEDGSWMICHWAGRTVIGIAGAMALLELLHAVLADTGVRQGLDMGAIILCGLMVLVPGRLIALCPEDTMRCHTAMAPAVRVFAILIAAVSAADFFLQMGKDVHREIQRRRERRKAAQEAEEAIQANATQNAIQKESETLSLKEKRPNAAEETGGAAEDGRRNDPENPQGQEENENQEKKEEREESEHQEETEEQEEQAP